MGSRVAVGVVALAAFGCQASGPVSHRPVESPLLFMYPATYVGTLKKSQGRVLKLWRIDRPFKDVFADARAELPESRGWKTKSVDSPTWIYSDKEHKAVFLAEGAPNADGSPIEGTDGTATTVATDRF